MRQLLSILYLRCARTYLQLLQTAYSVLAFNSLFEMHGYFTYFHSSLRPWGELSILYLRCDTAVVYAHKAANLLHLSILYLRCEYGRKEIDPYGVFFQFSI